MDTLKLTFLLAFSLLLGACGSKNKAAAKTENNEENPIEVQDSCFSAVEELRLESPAIAAHIIDYTQEGNCIFMNYQYSGCQKGRPYLVVTEKIYAKKSMILKLSLLMDEAGECDMLISEKNYFKVQNIAPDQDLSLSFNEGNLIVEFKNP